MKKIIDQMKKNKIFIGLGFAVLILIAIFWKTHDNSTINKQSNEQLFDTQIKKKVSSTPVKADVKESSSNSKEDGKIVIDISGEVINPGIYELAKNARMHDAIKLAGGLTKNADTKVINQALKLKDEQKIYIFNKNEAKTNNIPTPSSANEKSDNSDKNTNDENKEKININEAQLSDFQKLNGIGQKKAQQIIDYRDENGDFKSIDDLDKVNGIGKKTVETLREQITI